MRASGVVSNTPPVCPVCRWPDQGDAICDRCGWELRGGYVVGWASPDDERELAAQITDARRRHDLRAAVHAAGSRGHRDHEVLSRLSRLARGGRPRASEINSAIAEIDAEEPLVWPVAMGTGFALRRLVAEDIEAIAFVEISPDAVSVEILVTDELGVPVRKPGSDSLAWPTVLPMIPADDDLRRFLFAGGIGTAHLAGTADPAALAAAVEETVGHVVTQLVTAATAHAGHGRTRDLGAAPHRVSPRIDTVLVRRSRRWPILEVAAARARGILRPVAEIVAAPPAGTLAQVVTDVARQAPLRYGYDLILVDVHQGGRAVQIDRWPLFAAGFAARADERPAAEAIVKAPEHPADRLALPVVARRGADQAHWPLVGMAVIDGTTQETIRLQVRLAAPGHVSIRATPDVARNDSSGPRWPALLSSLPPRLPSKLDLDLAVLVELGGSVRAVADRVALARGLVSSLQSAAVRIAVIGYRDHFGVHRLDARMTSEMLIVGGWPECIQGAYSALDRADWWQAVKVGDDHAAPLEDALVSLAEQPQPWRPAARHALLVLGSRPPHPSRVDPHGDARWAPCPHGLAWQHALDRLRHEQQIERITVLDQHAYATQTDDDTARAWKELGADGLFSIETAEPRQLAQALGLASLDGVTPLCLAARAHTPQLPPSQKGR